MWGIFKKRGSSFNFSTNLGLSVNKTWTCNEVKTLPGLLLNCQISPVCDVQWILGAVTSLMHFLQSPEGNKWRICNSNLPVFLNLLSCSFLLCICYCFLFLSEEGKIIKTTGHKKENRWRTILYHIRAEEKQLIKVEDTGLKRYNSAASAQQRNKKRALGSKLHFSLDSTGVLKFK